MLPAGAWLVNVAARFGRGRARAVRRPRHRQIAGAALDVYEREPYQPPEAARDLRGLDNVILVPHIGSNTGESNRRMSERAVRNVEHGAGGRGSRPWTSSTLKSCPAETFAPVGGLAPSGK